MSYLDQLFRLEGKVAAVTGGGGMLCGKMAKAFARAGCKVLVMDSRLHKAEDVVELIKGPRYYDSAKVYCMIDMDHPEDESIYDIIKVPKAKRPAPYNVEGDEGDITYHVTLHVQECNNSDLAIYEDVTGGGNYFDLSGKNLETKEKEMA